MTRSRFYFIGLCFGLILAACLGTPAVVKADTGSDHFIYLPAIQSGSAPAAPKSEAAQVSLHDFVALVQDGQADVVKGVYVQGLLAFRIAQQPSGNPSFVSENENEITQFDLARQMGVTGLLAHNDLAGQKFPELTIGQIVHVVYGDGSIQVYKISALARYQALDPTSGASNFKDLGSGETLRSNEIFKQYYTGSDHVTLQTCINQGGNPSWGRLFVVATPLE
jgi:hypothetical protein